MSPLDLKSDSARRAFIGPHRPHAQTADSALYMRPVTALGKRSWVTRLLRKAKNIPRIRPILAVTGCFAYLAVTCVTVWVFWAMQDMPDTSDLWVQKRASSITFLDRHGETIGVRGSRGSKPIVLANMPAHLEQAVLATEDRRFHYHPGFDPIGIVRAFAANRKAGTSVQGGSTLTQQLAKNVYLSKEKTMRRKSQEVLLALWLEQRFTKTEILELYLGRVFFGGISYGVDAAAERYFAKPAADLTLGESAMLAGLLKAPSRYAPVSDPTNTSARTTVVLSSMVSAGYLSEAQKRAAFAKPIEVEPAPSQSSSGYFMTWVTPQIEARIGSIDQDIVVKTTLDLSAQKAGEAAIKTYLSPERGANQAALVALDESGGVRTMIGGADYTKSVFNRAVDAVRQPGSAFKPFVYLTALRAGVSPFELRIDARVKIGDWEPRNFSGRYLGEVSVLNAFAASLNTIAIILSEESGRKAVVKTGEQFGFTDLKPLPSIALGAQGTSVLTLTQSYLPFANFGYKETAYAIESISAQTGRRLYTRASTSSIKVLSGQDLRDMNLLMNAVLEGGTGKRAKIAGRELAGKTGTTNQYRDAWFVGYAADYVTGVWVGSDNNRPMKGVTGGSIPAQIWHDYMVEALKGAPVKRLPKTTAPIRPVVSSKL